MESWWLLCRLAERTFIPSALFFRPAFLKHQSGSSLCNGNSLVGHFDVAQITPSCRTYKNALLQITQQNEPVGYQAKLLYPVSMDCPSVL
jgi:hypothetical protein